MCLANITQYFYDKVQPKTQKGAVVQYALSIYVTPAQCTDTHANNTENEFDKYDAVQVKNLLNNGDRCEFSTESQNVIASRPEKINETTKRDLLNQIKNAIEIKKINQNCVVFYSYNSTYLKTCLQIANNTLEGIENCINKRKGQLNAFVFQEIWDKDKALDLKSEFKKIDAIVPLYRCISENNVMICNKCVENNDVVDFCLHLKQ